MKLLLVGLLISSSVQAQGPQTKVINGHPMTKEQFEAEQKQAAGMRAFFEGNKGFSPLQLKLEVSGAPKYSTDPLITALTPSEISKIKTLIPFLTISNSFDRLSVEMETEFLPKDRVLGFSLSNIQVKDRTGKTVLKEKSPPKPERDDEWQFQLPPAYSGRDTLVGARGTALVSLQVPAKIEILDLKPGESKQGYKLVGLNNEIAQIECKRADCEETKFQVLTADRRPLVINSNTRMDANAGEMIDAMLKLKWENLPAKFDMKRDKNAGQNMTVGFDGPAKTLRIARAVGKRTLSFQMPIVPHWMIESDVPGFSIFTREPNTLALCEKSKTQLEKESKFEVKRDDGWRNDDQTRVQMQVALPKCENSQYASTAYAVELRAGSQDLTGRLSALTGEDRSSSREISYDENDIQNDRSQLLPANINTILKGKLDFSGSVEVQYPWFERRSIALGSAQAKREGLTWTPKGVLIAPSSKAQQFSFLAKNGLYLSSNHIRSDQKGTLYRMGQKPVSVNYLVETSTSRFVVPVKASLSPWAPKKNE